jgi:hypothetical protein
MSPIALPIMQAPTPPRPPQPVGMSLPMVS